MSRTLEQALARFEAASNVHVVGQWVKWPEYEDFVTALRALSREAESVNLAGALRDDYERLWRIRRFIRTAPVQPSAAASEVPLSRAVAAGAYGEKLKNTYDALDSLCQSSNPLISEIRAYLNGERRLRLPSPGKIQILTDRRIGHLLDPKALAVNPQHTVSLLTVTEARRTDVADLMFVLGDPEDHDSAFKSWDARTRSVSWIFNAPSAQRIVCLLLNDCRPFDVSRFEVWDGAGQFDAIIEGQRERIDFNLDFVAPPFEEPVPVERNPGEVAVRATRFRLADGSTVYFSDDFGAKPRVLAREDYGLEVLDPKSLISIGRGSILLINASEASRSFITREADRMLAEKFSPELIASYRAVVQRYKNALLKVTDINELIRRALTKNLSETYIRQQLHRASLPDSFATQDRDRFVIICSILGLPTDGAEWEAVSRLQAANRAAGRVAKDRLREAIAADESLYERVLEPALVTIDDPELGSIIVSAVVETPIQFNEIGVSVLGSIRK